MTEPAIQTMAEASPIRACTVCRDLESFDLLIDDMEATLGDAWGDLTFDEALRFLSQPEAETLEFLAVAVDSQDEATLAEIGAVIAAAQGRGIKTVLVVDGVSPSALHGLMRLGADTFIPYPIPEGELESAIENMSKPTPTMPQAGAAKATGDRSAVILPVHGLAGGSGATTLAVNLAWELANVDAEEPPRVCLIDLDLQFGAVATALDLPRKEAVYEFLSDAADSDEEAFMQILQVFEDRLHVMTSPPETLPLDFVGPAEIERVLESARANFDYVVVDMPSTLVMWTEAVLSAAPVYFATLELDMRSAQNALRLIRALKAEDLPHEKLRYALNRAPKRTDLSGRSRAKRMSESLGITIDPWLPDGGRPVAESADEGRPLALTAAKNPLRREIEKLAKQVHETNSAEAARAA